MNFLFIYPDITPKSRQIIQGKFQYGIASISALLKKNGHNTSLIHLTSEPSKDRILAEIENLQPDIIGFSTLTNQYRYTIMVSNWAREKFHLPIVVGGIHPTLAPEEVVAQPSIDMVCVGEGEYPMLELTDALQKGVSTTEIQSLFVKAGGTVHRNSIRPPIEDLDALPFPDRDLFNFDEILNRNAYAGGGRIADIQTGRGCPFKCTYCCNHALRAIHPPGTPSIRRRSINNVFEEIRFLKARYKIDGLNFEDDCFALNKRWILDFCSQYRQELGLPFVCNTYPTTLMDKEVVLALKEAGCVSISIGLESGNEWLRKEILQRNLSDDQLRRAFNFVKDVGIKTTSYNIVGLPYETPEMARDTYELNRIINPDSIQLSIFYPYPGTQLFSLCEEKGWLTGQEKSSYTEGTVLNLPTMTPKQTMQAYHRLFALKIRAELRNRLPRLYPLYNALSHLLGEKLMYRASFFARQLLLLLHR